MGTPTDLPLAVPGSGPSAIAVPNVAGDNSEPMDDETMFQPVIAYFIYIHTKQPIPNYQWEHPASHEGSRTEAPSDNAWSSWLNPKWMVK